MIDGNRERKVAEDYKAQLNTRTPTVFQRVVNLSGGNQQKVVLAKWLFTDPDVLILDEPTRGIDVGAKFEIYSIINQLADQGRGVVMISSEMPELLGMCDRIYVMNKGAFVGELTRAEASQERIMEMIMTQANTGGGDDEWQGPKRRSVLSYLQAQHARNTACCWPWWRSWSFFQIGPRTAP